MYMTRGSLSTEHSTRRFGSDCPRRIIFAAFHVGSKRNCGGDWHSCVNTGCPFVVAVIERSVRFPLSRSFQLSATCPDTPALENVSPVVRFTTFHSPQSHPTDIVSSVRDRVPSPSASRPNTTSTPFDGVASSSIRTENSFASFHWRRHGRYDKRGGKKRGCKCHGLSLFPKNSFHISSGLLDFPRRASIEDAFNHIHD